MTVVGDTTVSSATIRPPRSAVDIPTRVLVFGMAHHDGTILGSELYPVAEACGQTPDQLRSCLRRIVGEGLFTREGNGPNAVLRATASGMAALGATMERTRLAYGQDAAGRGWDREVRRGAFAVPARRGWDRQWRLVAFAVPEAKRAARDAFRDRLLELGGAAITNGLYVSAHNWLKDVHSEADRIGVDALVTTATTDDLSMGGVSDPRELARRLWPLDDLAARYAEFVHLYESVPGNLEGMRRRKERLPAAEFLPAALTMAVHFQQVFNQDPLLPPELLPRPWPGRAARDLVVTSRRLALKILQRPGRPALFHLFDEALEAIP